MQSSAPRNVHRGFRHQRWPIQLHRSPSTPYVSLPRGHRGGVENALSMRHFVWIKLWEWVCECGPISAARFAGVLSSRQASRASRIAGSFISCPIKTSCCERSPKRDPNLGPCLDVGFPSQPNTLLALQRPTFLKARYYSRLRLVPIRGPRCDLPRPKRNPWSEEHHQNCSRS